MTSKVQLPCRLMHCQPRRPGDEVELFWLCKQKWKTFYSFQEQELSEIIAKTCQEQQEDNSEGDICYLDLIFAELNNLKHALLKVNIDGGTQPNSLIVNCSL